MINMDRFMDIIRCITHTIFCIPDYDWDSDLPTTISVREIPDTATMSKPQRGEEDDIHIIDDFWK